jgi:tetratricopeptide (TPR) repeat protein
MSRESGQLSVDRLVGRARRALPLAVVAALLLWVGALYAPVRHFGFVIYDDDIAVTDNAPVRAGLTAAGIRWSLTAFAAYNWHPVTWWSHMLDVTLFGMDAGGHHVVNAALHAANTALLFLLLRALTGRVWAPAAAAALFAVHPLRVESVAWVAERKDVLSALFWLLATLAWVRWCRRPTAGRYLGAAALLALGLMAKPMLATLPLSLLALDFWPLGRTRGPGAVPRGRLLLEKAPLLALSAAASVVTVVAQRSGGSVWTLADLPAAARLATALHAYGWYLKATLWPAGLAVPYLPPAGGWPAWQLALSGAVLAAVTWAALLQARRRPYLAAGWAWYLVTLLPVAGLLQVGSQAMADRYTYVPLIGPVVAACWGVAELAGNRRWGPLASFAAALVPCLALSVATAGQLAYWRSTETLLTRACAVMPENYVAHNNLGLALAAQRRWAEAAAQYRAAIAAAPGEGYPRFNLAVALEGLGRLDEAVAEHEGALARLALPGELAQVHAALGRDLERLGRGVEAAAHFERALALDPGNGAATWGLGTLYLAGGRAREAAALLARVAANEPRNAAGRAAYAEALLRIGLAADAEREYEAAAALAPGDPGVRAGLGRARGLAGRGSGVR